MNSKSRILHLIMNFELYSYEATFSKPTVICGGEHGLEKTDDQEVERIGYTNWCQCGQCCYMQTS